MAGRCFCSPGPLFRDVCNMSDGGFPGVKRCGAATHFAAVAGLPSREAIPSHVPSFPCSLFRGKGFPGTIKLSRKPLPVEAEQQQRQQQQQGPGDGVAEAQAGVAGLSLQASKPMVRAAAAACPPLSASACLALLLPWQP